MQTSTNPPPNILSTNCLALHIYSCYASLFAKQYAIVEDFSVAFRYVLPFLLLFFFFLIIKQQYMKQMVHQQINHSLQCHKKKNRVLNHYLLQCYFIKTLRTSWIDFSALSIHRTTCSKNFKSLLELVSQCSKSDKINRVKYRHANFLLACVSIVASKTGLEGCFQDKTYCFQLSPIVMAIIKY